MIMHQLIPYSSNINKFYTSDALAILDSTYNLSPRERELIENLLETVYQPLSKGKYSEIKDSVAKLKKICNKDWECYLSGKEVSKLHRELAKAIPNDFTRNTNLFHSIMRAGEFFYMSDDEMEELSSKMETFIDSGDCKLFDNENSPYPDKELTASFERDIKEFEPHVRDYLKRNNMKDIPAEKIIDALHQIKRWMNSPTLEGIPSEVKGMIQLCKEIRKAVEKEAEKRNWWNPGKGGIDPESIMKKMSGFCLNKEPLFREFCRRTRMTGWKNPEGSWLYGHSTYDWNPAYFEDMKKLEWWDMDVIYYSLGKGPWLKGRYVGQPCAFYQNVAEPLAAVVKKTIKKHHKNWQEGKVKSSGEGYYDAEGLNIYENYDYLLSMVASMIDSIAMDFSSYSDYLSRNTFKWVMKYLWGVPSAYADEIFFLMSLPIKVNGITYPHLHASVMGIKVNFLLITFSNFLMWMVGCIISGVWDRVKFMGDDRIQVNPKGIYPFEAMQIFFSVTAYFNCVVNPDKSEWLRRDKSTSFCKRTFSTRRTQISGLSGEFYLKQKPFLNDVSVWISTCTRNEIPLKKSNVKKWISYFGGYYNVTYYKFYKKEDPPLEEMMNVLIKIPYYFGGWSLDPANGALEEIILRSVLASVNTIIKEAYEERSFTNRAMIREYVKYNAEGGENNRYYQNLLASSSYSVDMETIEELIDAISNVLSKNTNTMDEIKDARRASQRLMEIVLQRDSRLANSSSTKNRIDYTFDQDRVSKIRSTYMRTALLEKQKNIKVEMIDSGILKDCLSEGYSDGLVKYMKYLDAKIKTGAHLGTYGDCTDPKKYICLYVIRKNPDGSTVKLKKRLTSADNPSHLASYQDENGFWKGEYILRHQLTKEEHIINDILHEAGTLKRIRAIDKSLRKATQEVMEEVLREVAELFQAYGMI